MRGVGRDDFWDHILGSYTKSSAQHSKRPIHMKFLRHSENNSGLPQCQQCWISELTISRLDSGASQSHRTVELEGSIMAKKTKGYPDCYPESSLKYPEIVNLKLPQHILFHYQTVLIVENYFLIFKLNLDRYKFYASFLTLISIKIIFYGSLLCT